MLACKWALAGKVVAKLSVWYAGLTTAGIMFMIEKAFSCPRSSYGIGNLLRAILQLKEHALALCFVRDMKWVTFGGLFFVLPLSFALFNFAQGCSISNESALKILSFFYQHILAVVCCEDTKATNSFPVTRRKNLWKRRSRADIGLDAIGFIVWQQLAWRRLLLLLRRTESHQDGIKGETHVES